MCYQRKEYAQAERLYSRSLDIRERYFLRHSDRVAQTLHNLATLALAQDQVLTSYCLLPEDLAEDLYKDYFTLPYLTLPYFTTYYLLLTTYYLRAGGSSGGSL